VSLACTGVGGVEYIRRTRIPGAVDPLPPLGRREHDAVAVAAAAVDVRGGDTGSGRLGGVRLRLRLRLLRRMLPMLRLPTGRLGASAAGRASPAADAAAAAVALAAGRCGRHRRLRRRGHGHR